MEKLNTEKLKFLEKQLESRKFQEERLSTERQKLESEILLLRLQLERKERKSATGSSESLNDLDDQSLVQLYLRFKQGVPHGDKTFMLKTFKNVFKGKDAMIWLEKEEKLSKQDAKKIGNFFLKKKLIVHVSSNLLPFTEACFYRST